MTFGKGIKRVKKAIEPCFWERPPCAP